MAGASAAFLGPKGGEGHILGMVEEWDGRGPGLPMTSRALKLTLWSLNTSFHICIYRYTGKKNYFFTFYLQPKNLKKFVEIWKLPIVLSGYFIKTLN